MKGVEITLKELLAMRHVTHQLNALKSSTATQNQTGAYRSCFKGRGMDFSEVRSYFPGDDIRHMDWRVTARMNQPYIKCYEEERERPVFFVVDQSASMRFGTRVAFKSVSAAKIAALLAWQRMALGDRVGGIVFTEESCYELRPQAGKRGVLPLLHALASDTAVTLKQTLAMTLSDVLKRLRRIVKQRGLIFVISDFYDLEQGDVYRHLSQLRLHHDCALIRVTDPIEQAIPGVARYPVSDGSQAHYQLDLTSRRAQRHYEDFFATRSQDIIQMCQRLMIPMIAVSTADDLLKPIRHLLAQAEG